MFKRTLSSLASLAALGLLQEPAPINTPKALPARTTKRNPAQQKAAFEAAEAKRQRKQQARIIQAGGTVQGDF